MAILLALDLSTITGFAYWKPGMVGPRYGRWPLPEKVGEETELVTLALRRKLHDYHALESFQDGTVVIERNIKKRTDKLRTLEILTGLVMEASTTARWLGAVPRVIDNGDMVKHWTGQRYYEAETSQKRRDIRKEYSMKAAFAKGWKPKDDNAADALGLLDYYAHTWKMDVPWDCRPCPSPQYLDLKLAGKVVG